MAFIHPLSSECTLSVLDLFTVPSTQVSIEKSNYVEFLPLASLKSNSTIEFNIIGENDTYLDLNDTLLYVRCKIVNAATGADLTDEQAAIVQSEQLLLHSVFR